MNIASTELSRLLFESSGWDDTEEVIIKFSLSDEPICVSNDLESSAKLVLLSGKEEWRLPAYDMGYMMRKLPLALMVHNSLAFLGVFANGEEVVSYVAGYYVLRPKHEPTQFMQTKADSPEDALVKLAIRLFKSGMLIDANSIRSL